MASTRATASSSTVCRRYNPAPRSRRRKSPLRRRPRNNPENRRTDVQVFYRSSDLRLGPRHHPDAGGLPRDQEPAHRAVSEHRAARRGHHRDLSGRVGRDGAKHRHAGHRAAAQRHRPSALLFLRERQGREHDHHALFRAGHQSRHCPGAGAEQAATRHAAPSARGAAAGPARGQGDQELPSRPRFFLRPTAA
jgi:hypothetical protein